MTNAVPRKKVRPGPWVAMSADISDSRKMRRLRADKFAAIGFLTCLTGYSYKKKQDGFVYEDDIDVVAVGTDIATALALTDTLVAIGSLSVVEGGWYINGFTAWQVTEDEEKARREYERQRKARQRAEEKAAGGSSRATVPDVPWDDIDGPVGQPAMSRVCPPAEGEPEIEVDEIKNLSAADATDQRVKASKDLEGASPIMDELVAGLAHYLGVKHDINVKVTDKFRRDMRLLVERGPRNAEGWVADIEEIKAVIKFVPHSYRDAIQSADSFRTHYVALRTEMKTRTGTRARVSVAGPAMVAFDNNDQGDLAAFGGAA